METKELVRRAKERLEGTSKPQMPPEETLKAIIELGGEKSALEEIANVEREKSQQLAAKIETLERSLAQTNELLAKVQERAKNAEWTARELGKFVADVACNFYNGKEREAARRVYDLNKGSIARNRLVCYDFESLEDATKAYKEHCAEKGIPYDNVVMLSWLFTFAPKGE